MRGDGEGAANNAMMAVLVPIFLVLYRHKLPFTAQIIKVCPVL